MKESQEQAKLQKEKEDLSEEVDRCKAECAVMSKEKSETEKSHLRLKEKLQQIEKELTKTEALLEAALRERSAVDGKLGKATSELELAVKKAAIQERVLARGEAKYQEREEDIRVLKLEVKRLRHEETLLVSFHNVFCFNISLDINLGRNKKSEKKQNKKSCANRDIFSNFCKVILTLDFFTPKRNILIANGILRKRNLKYISYNVLLSR